MSRHPISPLSVDELTLLASQSGLPLQHSEIEAMLEHRLLVPLHGSNHDPCFCRAHLFVLARYVDTVRVCHHPWSSAEDLAPSHPEGVAELSERVVAIAEALRHGHDDQDEALIDFVAEIERYLHEHDPFGPLGAIVDLLRDDVIDRLSGAGRLWAELQMIGMGLAEMAEQQHAAPSAPAPRASSQQMMTRPQLQALHVPQKSRGRETTEMTAPSIHVPQRVQVSAKESLRTTAEMDALSRSDHERDEAPEAIKVADERSVPTQEIKTLQDSQRDPDAEAPTTEQESDPQEGEVGASDSNPFARDRSALTSNSRELQQRLEALQSLDGSRPRQDSIGAKAIALSQAARHRPDEGDEVSEPDDLDTSSEVSEAIEHEPIYEESGSDQENPFTQDDETIVLDRQVVAAAQDAALQEPDTPSESSEVELGEISEPIIELSEVSEPAQPAPEEPGESLAERIGALNQMRGQYMRDQNWSGLAELYEEGLELFAAPEQQQVLLTLSKLYEIKLREPERAFQSLTRAYDVASQSTDQDKIMAMMSQLARKQPSVSFGPWLDAQLDRDKASEPIYRAHAERLVDRGDPQRALLVYAGFLSDDPDQRVTSEAIETLERLASHQFEEEMDAIYDGMIASASDAQVISLIAARAGVRALDQGDHDRAIHLLSQANEGDETIQEQTFHLLSHLYEEQRQWSALCELIERRIAQHPEGASALEDALRDAREREANDPDEAIAHYGELLSQDPEDDRAISRLIEIYSHHGRHAEVYAFLNRHIERLTARAQRVRLLQMLAKIAARNLYAPEEAAVHYERALAEGGPSDTLVSELASVRMETGQWTEFVAFLERAANEKPDPEHGAWLFAGAQAAQRFELSDDARQWLTRLLHRMPGHEQAQRMLSGLP